MTSLMALHEITGEKRWLEMSRNLANLVATWTVSYDYELPKETELGALGAKLAGVYWASTQNKHGAPGICTSSGDALFKIYRATGDRRYAELLRDIAHAWQEGVKPGGGIGERLTYCDADSRGMGRRRRRQWLVCAQRHPDGHGTARNLRPLRQGRTLCLRQRRGEGAQAGQDGHDAPDHQSHQVRRQGQRSCRI